MYWGEQISVGPRLKFYAEENCSAALGISRIRMEQWLCYIMPITQSASCILTTGITGISACASVYSYERVYRSVRESVLSAASLSTGSSGGFTISIFGLSHISLRPSFCVHLSALPDSCFGDKKNVKSKMKLGIYHLS